MAPGLITGAALVCVTASNANPPGSESKDGRDNRKVALNFVTVGEGGRPARASDRGRASWYRAFRKPEPLKLSVEIRVNAWMPTGVKLVPSDKRAPMLATFKWCVATRGLCRAALKGGLIHFACSFRLE
jgi:hypothetical protein